MVIKIKQRETVFSHEFDVHYNRDWRFDVKMGSIHAFQKITIKNDRRNIHYLLSFVLDKNIWLHKLNACGKVVKTFDEGENIDFCSIHQELNPDGTLSLINDKISEITFKAFARGITEFITVYKDNEQIGLIEHSLKTYNGCYNYVVYLLDKYEEYGDFMVVTTMYFHALHNYQSFENRNNVTSFKPKKYGSEKAAGYSKNWLSDNLFGEVII